MNQAAGRFVLLSLLGAAIVGAVVILALPDYRPVVNFGDGLHAVQPPPAVVASNRAYMPGVRVEGTAGRD